MTSTAILGSSIVLQSGSSIVADLVSTIVPILLSVIGAIVILIIGWIIGSVLGGIIKRVIEGISPSQYLEGAPIDVGADTDSNLAQAFGDLVKYVIIFLALLLALDSLSLPIPGEILSSIVNVALHVIIAAVILVVGFTIGSKVGDIIGGILSGFGLDSYVEDTPLGSVTDSVGGTGYALGKVIEFIIYYLTLVAAVNKLNLSVITEMFAGLTNYLPVLIGALIVLLIGIFVADMLGDIIADAGESKATDYAGLVVQVFVYYVTATIVLNRLGLQVEVLQTAFNAAVTALFGALGLGLAIAIGIGVGWGSKDFVADNIDDWFGSAKDSASDMTDESDSEFESPSSDD